jgi:hypothetical protein
MDPITIVIGLLAVSYGFYTLVIRIKKPEKFGKLEAMKSKFGNKAGIIIHTISYSLIPIVAGIVFVLLGLSGKSIF